MFDLGFFAGLAAHNYLKIPDVLFQPTRIGSAAQKVNDITGSTHIIVATIMGYYEQPDVPQLRWARFKQRVFRNEQFLRRKTVKFCLVYLRNYCMSKDVLYVQWDCPS